MISIAVKVQGDRAIVRKTIFHGNRKVAGKYGLTVDGEWVRVKEGELYPDECVLPAMHYSEDEEVVIGTIYESAEDLKAMGVEVENA